MMRHALLALALTGCFSDPGGVLSAGEDSSGSEGAAESASASSTSAGSSASGSGSGSASATSVGSDEGSSEAGSTSAVGSESGSGDDGSSSMTDDSGSSESTGADPLEDVYGPCTPECSGSPVTGCTVCQDGVACPNGGGVCTSACPGGDPNECPPPGPQGWLACIIGNCYLTCDQAPCPDGMTCAIVNLDGNKQVCVWAD